MAKIRVNPEIEITYDEFGDPKDPAMLLIMGLGTQMIAWRDEWCELLAAQGFRVIRYDNRDIGHSTHLDHLGRPSVGMLFKAHFFGIYSDAPYLIHDMAQDAVDFLDALAIEKAHIVGVSMGGMIAQELVLNHPERALSLTSMMSTTGNRKLPKPSRRIEWMMVFRPPQHKEEKAVRHSMKIMKAIGSVNEYAPLEDEMYNYVKESRARSTYQVGSSRQMFAILCSPSRVERLQTVSTRTLVIHGKADPLVHHSAGVETAKCIPNSRLELIDDMGHDMPKPLYGKLTGMIGEFAKQI